VSAAPALHGIVVADFTRVLAGPFATMTLGDLGADVIKVERPGAGDDTRAWGPPFVGGESTYFLGLNRNKRSLELDLGDAGDRELARRLARRADVLVESFLPGKMDRFGLGYESLAAENPGLVYCSISGFGSSPEAAELPGYDLMIQAMTGLMSITGEPDGPPLKVGVALVDMICGLYATTAILAALRARERDGQGQLIEVALFDAALSAMLNRASAFLLAGVVGERIGNRHPSIVPYQTFHAADGELAMAVGNDAIWQRMCGVLELADLAADERFATNPQRVAHVEELIPRLEAAFARDTVASWVARLMAAGVPAAPINDVGQAFAFAQQLGLDEVVTVPSADGGDALRLVRPVPRLGRTPARVAAPPPRLGEHSDELRAWLAADG